MSAPTNKAVIGTPHYSLLEASTEAKNAMSENYGADPWEAHKTRTEEVPFVYNKVVCVSKDKVPIFVTRASAVFPSSADKLFQTYWELEAKWNVSTVAHHEVVQDDGQHQIVYQQHKTLSAASAKRDLLFERAYEKRADGSYWVYGVSTTHDSKPEVKDYIRAHVVYYGLEIKPISGAQEKSELTLVWCIDFAGWLHAKFIEGEFSNVALRLARIARNVPVNAPTPTPKPAPTPVARPTPVNKGLDDPRLCQSCGQPKGDGKYCMQCGELISSSVNSL